MKKKLYWSITNACNLACRYCYYNTGLEERIYSHQLSLDYEKAAHIVAENFEEIVFTGGEPLLFAGLVRIVEILKQHNRRVSILTNGTFLTDEKCRALTFLDIDVVSISLDSLDETVNDNVRGRFLQARKGIDNMLHARMRVPQMEIEIMTTLTRQNIHSIRDLVDFCEKNSIHLWLDPVEVSSDNNKTKDLDLTAMSQKDIDALSEVMHYWSTHQKDPTAATYVENCLSMINGKKPVNISCPMGTENFILDPEGSMYPCFLRKNIPMGNIFKEDIQDILNNPRLIKEQENLQHASCVRLGCVCMTISNNYGAQVDKTRSI